MPGTSTSAESPRATDVTFYRGKHGACMGIQLDDGRFLGIPLTMYPTLWAAKPVQRQKWRLIGKGHGIHWPLLDLDLSTSGLVAGRAEMTRRSLQSTGLTEFEQQILLAMYKGGPAAKTEYLAKLIVARYSKKRVRALLKALEKRIEQEPRSRSKSA